MRWIGALFVIAACHSGGDAMIDGTVEPPDAKADPGVHVRWMPTTALPGAAFEDDMQVVAVSQAVFGVALLEVVSPQGSTKLERFDLEWSAGKQPAGSGMPDATPGDYQIVKVKLDSVELRGTWFKKATNKTLSYRIETRMPFFTRQLTFAAKLLEAGGSLPLAIDLDVASALKNVPFESLRAHGGDDDGEIELEDRDPQMNGFRMAMFNAIGFGDD